MFIYNYIVTTITDITLKQIIHFIFIHIKQGLYFPPHLYTSYTAHLSSNNFHSQCQEYKHYLKNNLKISKFLSHLPISYHLYNMVFIKSEDSQYRKLLYLRYFYLQCLKNTLFIDIESHFIIIITVYLAFKLFFFAS